MIVYISEKKLIEWYGKYGNKGWNGGLMEKDLKYVKEKNGIENEVYYKYEDENEKWRYDNSE